MSVVLLTISTESYGDALNETIYSNSGNEDLVGFKFGDLETGKESITRFFYVRHNGNEKIYDVGLYLRAVGTKWGGYVQSADDAQDPYNPHFFKNGGLNENGNPATSTEDYNFVREQAKDNQEMGIRLHLDRSDSSVKTNGLGYDNEGLSFSPIELPKTSLDTSNISDDSVSDGEILPEPEDVNDTGKSGDEALIGMSMKFSEDVIGSGYVQCGVAIKYRYTT